MTNIGFERTAGSLKWREVFVHCFVLAVLLVPTYPGVFLQGELLSSSDILNEYSPWNGYAPADHVYAQNPLMFDPVCAFRPDYLLVQESMRAGEWPLWNPLEFSGVPLLANCQSTVFYPPRLLLMVLDVDTAMTVFVLFKLWLCGLSAVVCVRVLGMAVAPSRFFSVAWMLGSYNLIWGNWPLPDVSAWVPVLFLGCELLLRADYRRGFFATALGGAMILYAGHPETAFTFVMGIGFYFLFRLILDRRWGGALVWPIFYMSLGWAVALLVYAPQLFAFLEYLVNSYTFSEREGEEHNNPMPAGAIVATWVARFYGTLGDGTWWDKDKWNSNIVGKQYLGMVLWFGLAALLVRLPKEMRSREYRWQVIALLLAASIGVQMAYRMPTLGWVNTLPLFSSIREVYHLCFALFALPLLGTFGLQRWFARQRSIRELVCVVPLIVVASSVIWVLYRFNFEILIAKGVLDNVDIIGYVREQILIAAVTAMVVVAVFAISCFWYRPRVMWPIVTVLFAADQWVACRHLNPTMPETEMYPSMALTDWMEDRGKPVRFGVAEGAILSGAVANYGLEEWLGYDGLMPERVMRYQKELGTDVWDHAEPVNSVAYYFHEPNPAFEPLFPMEEMLDRGDIAFETEIDGVQVYKNLRAFPRASLLGGLRSFPDRDALFEAMLDPDFRPEHGVVTMASPDHALPEQAEERPGLAEIVEYDSTRVVVRVDAERDGVLVLTDAFYPGWHATVDGTASEIFPAYYAFRGVIVSAGQHEVVFEYSPSSLKIGLLLSSLTMVMLNLVCLRVLLRRRSQSAT
jgi:hypothetical protein